MSKEYNVWEVIQSERKYQDSISYHSQINDAKYSISDWVIFMENKLNEAKNNIYNLNSNAALESIRKITALGTACMEYNQTPKRK